MSSSWLPRPWHRERSSREVRGHLACLAATPALTGSWLPRLSQRERALTQGWHTTARLAATPTLTRSSLARLPARENGFQSQSEAQPAVHHATCFSFPDRRHRAATAGNASTPLRSRPSRRPNSIYVHGRKDRIFFSRTSSFLENPETQFRAPPRTGKHM